MLMSLKEILAVAEEHDFTVGAFNVTESSMFRAVVETAEKNESPAIIAAATNEFAFAGREFYAYVVSRLEKSRLPFALHLDHGHSLEDCVRAVQAGFTSVMIDGSLLPYEENVALTRKAVELGRGAGVSVEGEIGTIGINAGAEEGGVEGIVYTDPDTVLDFIERTGVDALAVAIGTAHGQYPKGFKPHLRLDILQDIRSLTDVPLVLHGGSDNPDEEIEEGCRMGIRKVNISSDFKVAYYEGIRKHLNETDDFYPAKVLPFGMAQVERVVAHKMKLFHSIGASRFY
ncbi:MAG: ketose-bisphosphate aldolase [Hungatella sp.]|nr:ketose-bisphosphate aldolase [Hungatella sp.]